MTAAPRPLIAGNWKMNGIGEALTEAEALMTAFKETPARARVALCPPATLIHRMALRLEGSEIEIGAQDLHAELSGAFTGDVSAAMVKDAGASIVILGHSERRTLHREDDARVARKVEAALSVGLEPIICVGETLQEREGGEAEDVVRRQLAGSLPASLAGHAFAIAYEPVWAIGTGLTPTMEQIASIHAAIRAAVTSGFPTSFPPILYGGSVKPGNAREILAIPDVGGALVGGASLKASDFLPIIRAV